MLIGDHKQLRPIVKDPTAANLGLTTSLFERYALMKKTGLIQLEEQYRMVSGWSVKPGADTGSWSRAVGGGGGWRPIFLSIILCKTVNFPKIVLQLSFGGFGLREIQSP